MKKLLLVLAAVAALGVGLIAVAAAGAQEGEDGPVQSFLGRVADKLGITEEQLSTAVTDVRLEVIDEKLAAGEITEEQAVEMRERAESGEFGLRPGDHPRPGHCRAGGHLVEATARILGIEPQKVMAGLQQGKSFVEIAAENGMGEDEYKAALTEAFETKLAQLVEQGRITEEEAREKLARFTEYLDKIINHHPEPGQAAQCRHERPRGPRPDGAPNGDLRPFQGEPPMDDTPADETSRDTEA